MNKGKVLIIDSMPQVLLDGLTKIGYSVDYLPDYDREQIKESIDQYVGLVLRSKTVIDKELIDKGANLQFIARGGSGMENIDEDYATNKGIQCINAPEGNRDAVGEHTVAMLLSILNNLHIGDEDIRKGLWLREKNRGFELRNKTIGIIGYGNMGSAFARRLQGFDVEVIAYDITRKNYSSELVTEVDLNTIFEKTDILSLHVPLTPETTYMVNNDFLERFHKNIYLINTARGKVVNTKDLVAQIEKGKVISAALDVLEFEEDTFQNLAAANGSSDEKWLHHLLNSNKVLLSPHVAGLTHQSKERIGEVLVEKISKLTVT